MTEVMGIHRRFNWQNSPGYGWDGVVVAIIGRNHPLLDPLRRRFSFPTFAWAGSELNLMSDVPYEMVIVIQSIIILLITAEAFLSQWRYHVTVRQAGRRGALLSNPLLKSIISTDFGFAILRVMTPLLLPGSRGGSVRACRRLQHRPGRDHAGCRVCWRVSERVHAQPVAGVDHGDCVRGGHGGASRLLPLAAESRHRPGGNRVEPLCVRDHYFSPFYNDRR